MATLSLSSTGAEKQYSAKQRKGEAGLFRATHRQGYVMHR